jgi:hypothetical protein
MPRLRDMARETQRKKRVTAENKFLVAAIAFAAQKFSTRAFAIIGAEI